MSAPATASRSLLLVAWVVAVGLAGCGSQDANVPTQSTGPPSATPDVTASAATPVPVTTVGPRATVDTDVPEEDSLPVSATAERDGIRLTLRLRWNPVYAGDRMTFTVTVENLGDETLRWYVDSCEINTSVRGSFDGEWRDSHLDVADRLGPYRDWLREEAQVTGPITAVAVSGRALGERQRGCADIGIGKALRRGESVTDQLHWDGFASPRLGLPPTGPATWTARFAGWHRGDEEEDELDTGEPLQVSLDSFVVGGRRPEALSPAEAIDAALADERLASWLVTRPLRSGADAIAEYDAETGLWIVGLLTYDDLEYGDPAEDTLHAALVDAITGEVVAVRETRVPR